MRERGLKLTVGRILGKVSKSLPMRERGLKQIGHAGTRKEVTVAPHAGAWIETFFLRFKNLDYPVAPHAGAWIET